MFNAAEYNFLVMYSKYYLESDSFVIITAWKLDFTAYVLQSEGDGKGSAWAADPSLCGSTDKGLWR